VQAVGNRTAQSVGGVNTSYTVDAADHLTAVNGAAVTSDANGNVTQDETGGAYSWDVRGRLVGLTKGGSSYLFQYGPDGLRLNKSVNGALTTYLLDGDQVVTDTINGTPYQTLYGPGTDHALARNGEFFLPNSLGSTSLLTDGSGNAGQSYQYRPFGELLGGVTDSNPFQYTGRENDGDGLLYYRARYYNPGWGRLVSADPMGFEGGINPDVYAGNNPFNAADPSGRVHLVANLGCDPVTHHREGAIKVFLDPGDVYEGTKQKGGELVGSFPVSNSVKNWDGDPTVPDIHSPFPAGTYTIGTIEIPPPRPISEGSGFIVIGGLPGTMLKGLHGQHAVLHRRRWPGGASGSVLRTPDPQALQAHPQRLQGFDVEVLHRLCVDAPPLRDLNHGVAVEVKGAHEAGLLLGQPLHRALEQLALATVQGFGRRVHALVRNLIFERMIIEFIHEQAQGDAIDLAIGFSFERPADGGLDAAVGIGRKRDPAPRIEGLRGAQQAQVAQALEILAIVSGRQPREEAQRPVHQHADQAGILANDPFHVLFCHHPRRPPATGNRRRLARRRGGRCCFGHWLPAMPQLGPVNGGKFNPRERNTSLLTRFFLDQTGADSSQPPPLD
jgi:RHS repeat-associated protein